MKQFKQITSPLPPILPSPLNPLGTKQKFFRNSLFHSPILGKYLKKKSIYFKYTSELLGLGWNMVFNPVPAALVCLSLLLCCNAVPIFCGIYRVIFLFIGCLCYSDTVYTVPVQVLYRTGLFVFCNRIEIKSNGREPDAAPKRVGKVLKKKYPT